MADEYTKRKDVVSALWKALYSYEDKTEKQFKEDHNLEIGEWFDHRIFVQACHGECLGEVLAIPSADVVEVRHGKWILKEILGVRLYGCSVCGKNYWWSTDNFCPNCGADMRKDGGQ